MAFAGINYLAVVMAAVAAFLFGGVWYGLLSSQWTAASGVAWEAQEAKTGFAAARPYIVSFVAELVMAGMLAGLMAHYATSGITLRMGLVTGAVVWAGFVLPSLIVNHAFQGAPRTLTWIDGGHWLGVLAIEGAILGWMGTG